MKETMPRGSTNSTAESTSDELLRNIEKKRQDREKEELSIGWYFWLLSEHPILVLSLCVVMSGVLATVGVMFTNHPDFSDPSKGFEVRGTKLADRLVTWNNMLNQTGYNKTLSNYPNMYAFARRKALAAAQKPRRSSKDKKKKKRRKRPQRKKYRTRRSVPKPYKWDFRKDGLFCENPKTSYAKWVFDLADGEAPSLWSTRALQSMCEQEKQLLAHPTYPQLCFHQNHTCCPTLSLPNSVAYLSGAASCDDVTGKALKKAERLLKTCADFYCRKELTPHCWVPATDTNVCTKVPNKCVRYNAAYTVFHYLLTSDVTCSKDSKASAFNLTALRRTAVLLPADADRDLLSLYYDNFVPASQSRGDDVTKVSGIDFGPEVKNEVFEESLFRDALFPAVAMAAVLLIILLYTGSIFITLSSVLLTTSAMFLSYFVYAIVLNFSYFPFMNVTVVLVLLGMSADNVLIFHSAWGQYADDDCRKFCPSRSGQHPLPNRVGVVLKTAMKHVAWSLFVTGFTTSAAFLSNYSSPVTAIKCFGMYAGLTVLSNLLLSLTWLPAAIVVHHKYFRATCCPKSNDKGARNVFTKLFSDVTECLRIFFQHIQVFLIVRLRFVWIVLFLGLASGSLYVVLGNPGLRLPDTNTYFQYFRSSHPFEVYALQQGRQFAFEAERVHYMPVRIVFGVQPTDNGDQNDPNNKGTIAFRSRFRLSDTSSQLWLLRFCEKLRNNTRFRPSDEYSSCFIASFRNWMTSRACTPENGVCCRQSFPYEPRVFERCLKEAIYMLHISGSVRLYPWTAGPRYDSKDNLLALVVEFESTQPYTGSFEEIGRFYEEMDQFLVPLLRSAPNGLKRAWFVSDLDYYSLQKGLYDGTISSVGLSLIVAQFVILVTSRNLLIALFANFTIGSIIFVTAGALVLLGWELNVLESVTISVAVGLSVDFTSHYAVSYLVAPSSDDRQRRVEFAVTKLGPAICVAALTTFIAGAGMFPTDVLAYNRFGEFLMIVMSVSWLYSTYFFLGLLSAVGPQGRCGDLRCRRQCCDALAPDSDEHTTVITETSSLRAAPHELSRPPLTTHMTSAEIVERSTVI